MKIKSSVKKILHLPTILYFVGFLITLIEIFLKTIGKSFCQTQGCKVVESYVKGSEYLLLFLGVILFGFLFFSSLKDRAFYIKIESYLLSIALAVEGYLLGFQSFIVKEFCPLCLTVFGIIFLASVFRFFKGKRELAFGFLSFASVLFITYFVSYSNTKLPNSHYVLIYSKECPYCKEVIQFCQENSIPVQAVEASEIKGVLKELSIESVPVLYCDEGSEKKFIIGSSNIKQYLVAKKTQKPEEVVCPLEVSTKCD
ncbi:MAG: hypothetical protein ABDH16_02275 [Thermodesulfovibrionaceae bacterium]